MGFGVLAVIALAGAGGMGCKPKQKAEKAASSAMPLLLEDLADLRAADHAGFAAYDAESGGRFSRVFGGTRNSDVVEYLDARLHHFFDPSDPSVSFSPAWFFGNQPPPDQKLGQGLLVLAQNVGLTLWLIGEAYGVSVDFNHQGRSVPVDSSRVGIMMLGGGYAMKGHYPDGSTFDLPAFYRQSVILHEARHSDCTGGISADQLRKFREAQEFDGMNCGHTHVLCPEGHVYAGEPVCDNEAWGAYTVAETFLRGIQAEAEEGSLEWQIATGAVIDNLSRVLVSQAGDPDMSSAGVR